MPTLRRQYGKGLDKQIQKMILTWKQAFPQAISTPHDHQSRLS